MNKCLEMIEMVKNETELKTILVLIRDIYKHMAKLQGHTIKKNKIGYVPVTSVGGRLLTSLYLPSMVYYYDKLIQKYAIKYT